jgi:glycosyltransferase involved in cell wall biosynthesis
MIVKNESALLADTLTHLRPFVDSAVICDTGSTDSTPQLIHEVCARLELPVVVHHHDWKGFGHNRSRAFASAHDALGTHPADWFMVFDADDTIVGDFPDAAIAHVPEHVDALYCTYGTEHMRYQRATFFRTTHKWGYRGVLHEYAYCLSKPEREVVIWDLASVLPSRHESAYYVHINSRGVSARSQNPNKYLDDARLLSQAIETESDPGLVSRYIFYTARSYMDARAYPEAIRYFNRYLEDSTRWFEERYDSRMGKARCMLACVRERSDAFSDSDIRDAFVMASVEDPERAEPWYELAHWCRVERNDFRAAYAFAKLGMQVAPTSEPPARMLFVDQTVYTYRLRDELAVAAYWTGRKQECLEHCTHLLARADLPAECRRRIEDNRKWCV